MPVTGYTNIDELEKLIPSRTLSSSTWAKHASID
jgi:ribonuclease I